MRAGVGSVSQLLRHYPGVRRPEYVVDVKNIVEMRSISFDLQHGLRLGAAVPAIEIHENADMRKYYPGLTEAAHLIGSLQIQSRASVGGNLCNGSPAADTTPALIALGAKGRVVGPKGERLVAVEEFCTGLAGRCSSRTNCWSSSRFPARHAIRVTPICVSSRATKWIGGRRRRSADARSRRRTLRRSADRLGCGWPDADLRQRSVASFGR
jgi:CO/xanthine dehydrogenase FAD-binding subunit